MRLSDFGAIDRNYPLPLASIQPTDDHQEMKQFRFADKPTKCAYMWRDIERRAAMYGIPARSLHHILSSSRSSEPSGVVGMREGWARIRARGLRRWFDLGREDRERAPCIGSFARWTRSQRVPPFANAADAKTFLMAETDTAEAWHFRFTDVHGWS